MLEERYYELSVAAARQQGFVTRAQSARLGVDDTAFDHLKQSKLLAEVDGDVYRLASSPVSPRYAHAYAAWLALAPDRFRWERPQAPADDAVLSHESAARLHGLGATALPRMVFTVPAEMPAPRATTLHVDRLAADDITIVEGIPVTTPLRTVLDLMRDLADLSDVARVLGDAVRKDLVDLREAFAALAPLAEQRGLRATGPAFVTAFLADLHPGSLSPRNLRAYAVLAVPDRVTSVQGHVAALLADLGTAAAGVPGLGIDQGLSRDVAAEIVGRLTWN